MSGLEKTSNNFFVRNQTLIAVTALAGVSAVGAYYYYSQQQRGLSGDSSDATGSSDGSSKKKKKSKKNKKKSAGESGEDTSNEGAAASSSEKLYPIGEDGLPNIGDEIVEKLSDKEKESWANALKEDGNTEFKAKKYNEAIAYYTAALKIKVDPVFYSNRSACYAALDDHEKVIEDTTAAINIKRDYTKCLLRRATSYEKLEKYGEAMFDLTAVTIDGGFNNKSVESILERVLKKKSINIVEKMMDGSSFDLPSASTIGSFFGAFTPDTNPHGISEESTGADKFLFDAIAQINLNTPEGYDNADSLINQAVEAYDITNLDPVSETAAKASIALEYASAFKFLRNDPTAATIEIEKAIALKPRARTYVYRALVNADKASFTQALADFEEAKRLEPNSADAYYQLGQLHYMSNELQKSEENFKKATELNPENVYAYVQLACIAYKLGNHEDAEAKFKSCKSKFPTSPEVPNYYGEILTDKGQLDLACKQFDTASRLQAALPVFSVGALPLINKAYALSKGGERSPEAEQLLIEACQLDPKSEFARTTLAQIKLQNEDVDEAIKLFEESAQLARTFEEKVQATSFAEATKMQKKIRADPYLSEKINELLRSQFA